MKESEGIIEQLASNTTELLNGYFKQAESLAVGTEELKIGIVHSISSKTGKLTAKSTIGFGRRIKASVEHEIDPDQIDLDFVGGNNGLPGKVGKRQLKLKH